MGKFTIEDPAKYNDTSTSEVAAAEHQARDDATKSGEFERGNDVLNSTPLSRDDSSGQAATSFWESIFGSKKEE